VERGIEGVLQVDTFAEAVGRDEDTALVLRQLGDLGASLVIAEGAGHCNDAQFSELALQDMLQPGRNVVGRGNVPAPHDGVKTVAQQRRDDLRATGQLRVGGVMCQPTRKTGEITQLPPFGLRQRGLGRFNRRGWWTVVRLLISRLEHVPLKLALFVHFQAAVVTFLQCRDGSSGARHHAAEQCERSPVADPLLASRKSVAGTDHL
jgi:hypothetical protein